MKITVKEAACRLGVHVNSVYNYIDKGSIKAEKVGKSYIVDSGDIDSLLNKRELTSKSFATFRGALLASISKDIDELISRINHKFSDSAYIGKEDELINDTEKLNDLKKFYDYARLIEL